MNWRLNYYNKLLTSGITNWKTKPIRKKSEIPIGLKVCKPIII